MTFTVNWASTCQKSGCVNEDNVVTTPPALTLSDSPAS
jgi:hypothetical protein